MGTLLSDNEIPKLPAPDLHDGVMLTKGGKYAGTTDGYSAEAMKAYADAREAAVLEKLAAHPPLGYVHPHAVERLKTGETVPFRKQPYKGERQIPVYAAPQFKQVPPPIDYDALIAACYARTKQAQGTKGCVQFAKGAEWYREQLEATPKAQTKESK